MIQAEIEFLKAVYNDGKFLNKGETFRDLCNRVGNSFKQNLYYLEKMERRGWYSSGVSLDLGWLEPEGEKALKLMFGKKEGNVEGR
jgi:hypothetical protein